MNNHLKPLILYGVVGLCATLVEWLVFYLLNTRMHYVAAVTVAYIISTFVNWIMGRKLVFQERCGVWREVAGVYMASVVGLGLNLLLMWIMVGKIGIDEMISKIIATVIVFAYNYLVRRLVIYRKKR